MRLLLFESAQLKIALARVGSLATVLGLPTSMRVFEIEDLTRQLELTPVILHHNLLALLLRKYWVHNDVKQVVDHPGQQLPQEQIRLLHAGIGVNFYQNGVQLLIDDEVVTKQLEGVFLVLDLALNSFARIGDQLVHLVSEVLHDRLFRVA